MENYGVYEYFCSVSVDSNLTIISYVKQSHCVGRKKRSISIGKRLSRSKHKISDSQSEGSIASYASDGDLQPEIELEPGNESMCICVVGL